MPTVKQARKLAALYDRPFLEFFAKDIPNVPETQLVPDFRVYHGDKTDQETDALRGIQSWAEEARLNALDLLELIGEPPPHFQEALYATVDHDVEVVAEKTRDIMGFPVSEQIESPARIREQFPTVLRAVIERAGVLVLRHSGLQKVRTRGICLYADPLPVIVYGNEAPGAQAFTLTHEFAHIILRQSAISGLPRLGGRQGVKRVESWCNKFAAAFLMPKNKILADMRDPEGILDEISDGRLGEMANRYAVSRHAMLIRLVTLGIVKSSFYWFRARPIFLKEEEGYSSFGRPSYYGARYRSSRGDFYTGLVLEAWNNGYITNHNAAEFMGIKNLSHLNDIRSNFKT